MAELEIVYTDSTRVSVPVDDAAAIALKDEVAYINVRNDAGAVIFQYQENDKYGFLHDGDGFIPSVWDKEDEELRRRPYEDAVHWTTVYRPHPIAPVGSVVFVGGYVEPDEWRKFKEQMRIDLHGE